MSKKLIFVFFFVFTGIAAAQSQGIEFTKFTDWEMLKKEAAAVNKYIFMDAYTDWCGWCKKMDKETFTDTAVGKLVNKNFISVQINMEEGFGKNLAMKYRVTAFPTLLFFSPKGRLVYKSMGYQSPDKFITTVQTVLDPKNQTDYIGISDIIGLPFPEFYKQTFEKRGTSNRKTPGDSTLNDYFDRQTDLFSEVNWAVMYRFNSNQKINNYFLDHVEKYRELYGPEDTDGKIFKIIEKPFEAALKSKNENELNVIITLVEKKLSGNKEQTVANLKMRFYEASGKWEQYADCVQQLYNQPGFDNYDAIDKSAWNIFKKCDNEKVVVQASAWMKPIAEKFTKYSYFKTYASLLYKQKEYAEAQKYAEKAIEIGKQNSVDVNDAEDIIKKIKEM